MEDYLHSLLNPSFHLTHRHWTSPICTLKWDSLFDLNKEVTTAIACIYFPSLPPNLFWKKVVFSLVGVVGKTLQVDMAVKYQISFSDLEMMVKKAPTLTQP